MSEKAISTSPESARRLAITRQHLAGRLPKAATRDAILSVMRDLCYVQLDPVSPVAPSHILTLWSRVGNFRVPDLDRLQWEEKKLFEYWSHSNSLVLMEDYPLFYSQMKRYPESLSKSWGGWREKARKFLAARPALRKKILDELQKGPRRLDQFEGYVRTKEAADGWSSGSDVKTMLFHLQMRGEVMIVGHEGNQKIWGLSEQFLPEWVERKELAQEDVEREAVRRTIRALGIASPGEINVYFLRGQYHDLKGTLERMEDDSTVHRVNVEGLEGRERRYVLDEDLRLLDSLQAAAWEPRMSLLSPLDNVLSSRDRVRRMFGFDYATEIYTPPAKRKFGYYVMPILWGDRFLGRIDPSLEDQGERLAIHSVHAEPGAAGGKEVSAQINETIHRLADFLGAKEVVYPSRIPTAWKGSLH